MGTQVREKHRNGLSDHVSINIYRLFRKNEIEFFTLHMKSVHFLIPLNCQWLHVNLVLFLVFSLCRPCGEFRWGFKEWGKLTSWEGKTFEISGLSGDLWDPPPPTTHFFYKYIASLNHFCALLWPSCIQAEWDWLYHTSSCSFTSVCMLVRSMRHLASTFPVTEAHSLEPIWINIWK